MKHMIRNGSQVKDSRVNVLGLTFKENCPDIRNTRVIDVIQELQAYGVEVHVHDPVSDPTMMTGPAPGSPSRPCAIISALAKPVHACRSSTNGPS